MPIEHILEQFGACLSYIPFLIVCIMSHYYSKNFSHRVAFNGVIKVADFGFAEDVYQCNYFRQGSTSVKLPIKWMAVESLHDRVFSEKSDVVCVYIAYEIHY